MSEQETLICQNCGQDHNNNLVKWCDRSSLEIKFQAAQDKIQQLEKQNKTMRDALMSIISAKESGCVDYKDCQCWHQIARQALKEVGEL